VLSFSSLMQLESMKSARLQMRTAQKEKEEEGSMGKRCIRWMHENGMREWVIPILVASSLCIKWEIGLGSYSGTTLSQSCP
jgi:alpha-1,3-glucosyltransferase